MNWDVMDARNLYYRDAHFDVILDKSTIDAITRGKHPNLYAAMALNECQRILKPGGKFVCISHDDPDRREVHLRREHLNWRVKMLKMSRSEKEVDIYIYVCTRLIDESSELWDKKYEGVLVDLMKKEMKEDDIADII